MQTHKDASNNLYSFEQTFAMTVNLTL